MLSEAAEKSEQASFKGFAFENDEERREFRIAAWLHDCGKIATPSLVDKGSKLETNYNRIDRNSGFEVLGEMYNQYLSVNCIIETCSQNKHYNKSFCSTYRRV
ncbi:hypothetical protein O9929_21145 [Vibrio lentus]|nr:hypothetical protein [Vibrio lentus]